MTSAGACAMTPQTRRQLVQACRCADTVQRFHSFVHIDAQASTCNWWTGAITNRGHGRFWLGRGAVVIAHRFAWALAYGPAALEDAPVLGHLCDNPLCVNPEHTEPTTAARNSLDWSRRRTLWSGPLADPRGSRRRTRAIRDGLRAGRPLAELLEEGRTALERDQLTLW